jgi:hypothetical protein
VSFIDGGLVGQGPIGDKTRYMLALRRSTIDFVLPTLIPDDVDLSLTTVPKYWDEQFRIDHQLTPEWKLTLSSLGTDDIFELYATKQDDEEDKRFFNRTRFLRVTGAARWSNGPWTANLALSGLLQQFVFEAGSNQFIDVRQPNLTPRAEVTRTLLRLPADQRGVAHRTVGGCAPAAHRPPGLAGRGPRGRADGQLRSRRRRGPLQRQDLAAQPRRLDRPVRQRPPAGARHRRPAPGLLRPAQRAGHPAARRGQGGADRAVVGARLAGHVPAPARVPVRESESQPRLNGRPS